MSQHHRRGLFLVFSSSLPWLFVVTTLSPSSSSLDWNDDSIEHPSTLILDLFSPSHFSSFHRFPNCSRYHTRICFPISYFHLSSVPPLPPPSSRSALPSLPLSLSLYLARVQRSSRTDNIHNIQVHKTSQNTSIKPTLFSRFEVIIHQSAIPSHHPYPYPYVYTFTSTSHISHITITASNIVICIPHPLTHPIHGQPLKFAVLQVFSCVYSPSFVPVYTYPRHAFFIPIF